jgi:protein phosphatase
MTFLARMSSLLRGARRTNPATAARGDRATSGEHALAGRSPELRVEAGVASDPGCVRVVNEDALRVVRPPTPEALARLGVLAVVCDGMGGHEAGEVASHLALETIVQRLAAEPVELPEALVGAVRAANRVVHASAASNARLRGMGTTCCALVLRGGAAYCAHVGDSRAYLVRGGEIFLMTEDHSAVMDLVRRGVISREEARHHPEKNVISRALGSHRDVEVSSWPRPFVVMPNDAFLICSDGLYDLVEDDELLAVVGDGELHAQVACDRLIALARERGGHDNISVAVLRMREGDADARAVRETRAIEAVP